MAAAPRSWQSRFSLPPAESNVMRRLLRICGAAVGLGAVVVFGFVGLLAAASSACPPTSRDVTGVSAFLFIAAVGAAAARWLSPGIFGSLAATGASAIRTFLSAACTSRTLKASPSGPSSSAPFSCSCLEFRGCSCCLPASSAI